MADPNIKENSKEYSKEDYSDNDNINYDNINYDSMNNDTLYNVNLDNNSQDNDFDIETEEVTEEMELLEEYEESEETEEPAPKKTPLQHLEKLINIVAGFAFAFADSWDYQMYFYFSSVILFLISCNVLSPWNKAIQRQTYRTNGFRIYFYLRTLIGIIIAICAYDIFLTKHYDTSAYSIILWCILILCIVECIDEVLGIYRSKKSQGKVKILLSCCVHIMSFFIVCGFILWVIGWTLYLSPKSITIQPVDTPKVQFVNIIGNQGHLLDFYDDTEAYMDEDKLLLLMGDIEGKELRQLKWDEYLNYEKMKRLCKSYYNIDFRAQNDSDNILTHAESSINVIGNQAFLVVDRGVDNEILFRRNIIIYELQLSSKTMNMLKNYFTKLQG